MGTLSFLRRPSSLDDSSLSCRFSDSFSALSDVSSRLLSNLLFTCAFLFQIGKRTVQYDLQSPICLYFFISTSPEIISVTSLCKRTVQCDLQSPIILFGCCLSNHPSSIVTSV